ncbi:MAG: DUF1492 domain-containing protein [Selenomonadaceae bacterium]|nr:DUF1492 domain-containing protein [Selenomonadaceae bacterium]MBR6712238.1 DUF1492 domain-containing protein [Selenomonadaceae bacterium]
MTEKELNSVREISRRIRDLEWRLQTLRAEAENIVPVIDGLPHATQIKSRVEKLALNITDCDNELINLREQFVNSALELGNKIDNAKLNSQEKTVLSLRYVSCMNFQDIWLKLDTSDANIFYLHRTALKKILKN